jgi:hypothetical protein
VAFYHDVILTHHVKNAPTFEIYQQDNDTKHRAKIVKADLDDTFPGQWTKPGPFPVIPNKHSFGGLSNCYFFIVFWYINNHVKFVLTVIVTS